MTRCRSHELRVSSTTRLARHECLGGRRRHGVVGNAFAPDSLTTEMTEVRFDAPQNNLSRDLLTRRSSRHWRRLDYFGERFDDRTRPRTDIALGTHPSPYGVAQ